MARPDQSMSLLADVREGALEPGYMAAASRGEPRSPWRLALTVGLLAALIALAGLNTFRSAGDVANERTDLVARVEAAQLQQSTLEGRARDLDAEIRSLRDAQVTDPELRAQLASQGAVVGDVPVRGPGIRIDIDDAAGRTGSEGLVFDADLSRLVNGLWQAGAEAITINGRRLSAQTPIRSAGSAITVDYVSLNPPYTVEAIGDPATLQARFARTSAAVWWNYIRDNYGVVFTVRDAVGELEMPVDPGIGIRYATAGEGN